MTESLLRVQRRFDYYLFDLILLGCVADPIIYAVRMRPVRAGYSRIWNSVAHGVGDTGRYRLRGLRRRVRNRSNETGSSTTDTGRRSAYAVSTVFA